ncbi:MAG: response regulator [Vicinamibacterales bacterium]
MATEKIRVLCVDDHRIVRDGLAMIINREHDMSVIAAAATAEQGIDLFRRYQPDVTLMDLQLGSMSGVEAIRAIRVESPSARIVVLTMSQGDEDVYSALQAGATTYLLKDTVADDLVDVIREVSAGRQPTVVGQVQARLEQRASRPHLSPREVQVTELISHGMRNKEIAAALGISEETVQVHVKKILSKLGVQDRTAVIRVAVQRGIIHIN